MSRAFRQQTTESNTHYPRLLGTHGAVTSEHYLATQAGADLLKAGGNAVDAAVGAVLVEGVVDGEVRQGATSARMAVPTPENNAATRGWLPEIRLGGPWPGPTAVPLLT